MSLESHRHFSHQQTIKNSIIERLNSSVYEIFPQFYCYVSILSARRFIISSLDHRSSGRKKRHRNINTNFVFRLQLVSLSLSERFLKLENWHRPRSAAWKKRRNIFLVFFFGEKITRKVFLRNNLYCSGETRTSFTALAAFGKPRHFCGHQLSTASGCIEGLNNRVTRPKN